MIHDAPYDPFALCADCGAEQDLLRPFPVVRVERRPMDGGGYSVAPVGVVCWDCSLPSADRREVTPSLMPEESGSVGTSSPSTESPGGVSRSGS